MSTGDRFIAAIAAGFFGNLAINANDTMPAFVKGAVTVIAISTALITLMPNERQQP